MVESVDKTPILPSMLSLSLEPQEQILTVEFSEMKALQEALDRIMASRFPIENISVLANDLTSADRSNSFFSSGKLTQTLTGAATWLEGIFALLIGASFLWLEEFGPLIVVGGLSLKLEEFYRENGSEVFNHNPLRVLIEGDLTPHVVSHLENHIKRGDYILYLQGKLQYIAEARELLIAMPHDSLSIYNKNIV